MSAHPSPSHSPPLVQDGWSPLFIAAYMGHPGPVASLLELKADPTAKIIKGYPGIPKGLTALQVATQLDQGTLELPDWAAAAATRAWPECAKLIQAAEVCLRRGGLLLKLARWGRG